MDTHEPKLRHFFDLSRDLFCIVDRQGAYLELNPSWERVFGYTRDELRSMKAQDLMHPDDFKRITLQMPGVGASGGITSYDCRMIDKRGQVHWFEWSVNFLEEEQIYYSVGRETTESKRALIRQDEERSIYEMIARGAPLKSTLAAIVRLMESHVLPENQGGFGTSAMIMLVDENGLFLQVGGTASLPESFVRAAHAIPIGASQGGCGTAAYLKKEILNSDVANDPIWAKYRELMLSHGIASSWSIPILGNEERVLGTCSFYFRERYEPTPHDRNLALMALHLARIAIERDLERAVVRESNDRFRQVAETIEEVFWITDLRKNQMIYISPGYEKIWGRSRESLYDRPLSFVEAIHADDRQRVVGAFPKQVSGGYDVIYRVVQPSGAIRWVRDRSYPVRDEKGETYRVAGIAADVTELKEAQNLISEQQMTLVETSKMSALGEMAGGIAHEINNPLAIIHGRAAQLKELAKRDQISVEIVEKVAEKIETTALRITRIVKSLRTFAREAEKEPFRPATVKSIIDDTLELCRERFKNHDIELQVAETASSLAIECRSVQISQVILNLLVNAHDAIEQMPEKWVRLDVKDQGDQVEISVLDSGPGIPRELQEKIMLPFFTTKEPGKGTGIGLSISRGIVEGHGGMLGLDTASMHTRFVVTLPKKQAKVEPKSI